MLNIESIPIVKYDNFLKSKYISWSSVGGRVEKYPEWYFGDSIMCYFDNISCSFIFSFRFYDNKIFLVLKFKPQEYKLKINDSVSFLFEDNALLNYTITTEPYKAGVYSEFDSNKFPDFFETLIPISINDVELFSKRNLYNYALNFKSYKLIGGNREKGAFWKAGCSYDNDNNPYHKKETFQDALRLFATTFLEVINIEIPDYKEIIDFIPNDEICFVYLMHDLKTNFYKLLIRNKQVGCF